MNDLSIIPTRIRRLASLDTSALGNVLDSRDTIEHFANAVRRKHATVFISNMVLFEISSDGDVERVFHRLQQLQTLCRKLGPLLRRSLDHKDLIQSETQGWIKDPVSKGWGSFENASSKMLREIANQLPESYDWMKKKKDELYELDRSMSKYLAERNESVDAKQIVEAIGSRQPPRTDDLVIEMAVSLSKGLVSAERVVAEKERFKATHVTSHLIWRLGLANAVDPRTTTSEQEQVVGLWRTKSKKRGKGTWYDMFIAGAAAYSDFLVSDDDDQRRRCEHLKKIGLLSFRSITVQEFLR